jgi:pyruvate/2-oxoglutarate/acetoin dehydrogenase E1 component/TPP-dependent pyruvate/acetoin dehydrogenase alpha subunit
MEFIVTKRYGFRLSAESILDDYKVCYQSRQASLLARKEVLGGKASFGIFGEGVEVPQVALSRIFKKGDYKSGYYRDQTLAFKIGQATIKEFFAQLYADPFHDPHSSGRQMSSFFASSLLQSDGSFKSPLTQENIISEIAPTAGQMPRLLGLAYASKLYRQEEALKGESFFSKKGQEIVFGTIGDASTAEGLFFEVMNAAALLQVPLPTDLQTVHASISQALKGFATHGESEGLMIYEVKGFDYEALCETYLRAEEDVRLHHKPTLIHVTDLTQPQGHSTSGSHERYKTKERLAWEEHHDGLKAFRNWIIEKGLIDEESLKDLEYHLSKEVKKACEQAYQEYLEPLIKERQKALDLIIQGFHATKDNALFDLYTELQGLPRLHRSHIQKSLFHAHLILTHRKMVDKELTDYLHDFNSCYKALYNSHLYSSTPFSPLNILEEKAHYLEHPLEVDGRQLIVQCFDHHLSQNPKVFIIGEDVGSLGGVNLEFEGLMKKFGPLRVTDAGIREASILGQGMGAALRGLRPLVDIQYLDYFLYAVQTASDDLATLFYRTAGRQKAPVIIRTKGHRLEGIWHTGSPMSYLLGSLRGIYICVPRNMTKAVGFYNTLFQGDNPALVIEVLNAYRNKEHLPINLSTLTTPLGQIEVLKEGKDITLVTYGACCAIALKAAETLTLYNVSLEVIDIQCLLPFDRFKQIKESLKKTHALMCLDEDVPGGATAYMLERILEEGFDELDCPPRTLCASENRVAYGRDGDYYSKPNEEDIIKICFEMMASRDKKFCNYLTLLP